MVDDVIDKMLSGQVPALSRLISKIERGDGDVGHIMEKIRPHTGQAHTIGITGPPGSGKSTLTDKLTSHLREQGKTVGILAVDPSSPFSGGALLGDRLRMRQHYLDPAVFIRSMATRGALGGLSAVSKRVLKLLDAAQKDVVILETVGVGQTEFGVMDAADSVVVVLVPEAGDAIQTLKAGLLEVADVFVVNKSDRTGAKRMATDLEMSVMMGPQDDQWTVPVMQTQAHRNIGVAELWDKLVDHRKVLEDSGRLEDSRRNHRREEFFEVIQETVNQQFRTLVSQDADLGGLIARVENGELDSYHAAQEVLSDSVLLQGWFTSLQGE
ncbi:MAG: methylmalonyl Co-A mutase-associated GTPase MeaB [SAR202 cluster bacterium]|nr:methylmalonyl Co-A mutase-associated GTPase MeaB [SAR202 cluster bacterium]|tara:strand:- start:6168 stop:7145 length:978 start_codon:yes stop_codon:yes gene_type:complete